MASYSSPSASDIESWTGVNRYFFGQQQAGFDTLVGVFLTPAEAETAQSVGAALFQSSGLTAQQVTLLQWSVANRTAARILSRLSTEKVTGTMQPLLIDGEELERVLARYREDASSQEGLAVSGEGVEVTNVVTGFNSETVSIFKKVGDLW